MMSMGIAVRMMTGPLPYAAARDSDAIVSPTEAAGAEAAMPMTVSCTTPIASDSSPPDASSATLTGTADRSVMSAPLLRHQVQMSYVRIVASPESVIQTKGHSNDRQRTPSPPQWPAFFIYAERAVVHRPRREPAPGG